MSLGKNPTSGSQCSVRHIDFQKFMQKETDAVVNAYCRKHKYDQHDIETKRMLVRENLILLEDIIACGGMPMPLTKEDMLSERKKECAHAFRTDTPHYMFSRIQKFSQNPTTELAMPISDENRAES